MEMQMLCSVWSSTLGVFGRQMCPGEDLPSGVELLADFTDLGIRGTSAGRQLSRRTQQRLRKTGEKRNKAQALQAENSKTSTKKQEILFLLT